MQKLVLTSILIFVLAIVGCVKQYQSGVKTAKTSTFFSDYVKVKSCSPILTWEAVDPVEYSLVLDKAVKNVEKQQRKLFGDKPLNDNETQFLKKTLAYDVAVYETIISRNKILPPERGARVFYKEGIDETKVKVELSLSPKTKYFWSVRVRFPDGRVSRWSTYNKTTVVPGGWEEKSNYWFGIKTPRDCNNENEI